MYLHQYLIINLAGKINRRHEFLGRFITTKEEENYSFEMVNYLVELISSLFVLFSLLEIIFYYLYNFKVCS